MWLIFLIIVICILIYKIKKDYQYWEERGVPYLKPFPLLGMFSSIVFRKKPLPLMGAEVYNLHPNERYTGAFMFTRPTLMIRDTDLIKQIFVKDFDAFPDHKVLVIGEADPLLNKNLFSMTTKNGWHDMRATLSPSFTSSKMRSMFVLIQQCVKQFVDHFKDRDGIISIELKDTASRFTNDVIGTAAFGITCNSLKDRNNEFYLMGKEVSNFSLSKLLRIFGYVIAPSVMKLFKVKVLSDEVTNFFRNIIKETVRVREEKQIVRPDMIHLLMEARKGRLKYDDQSNADDSSFAVVEESEEGKNYKRQKKEITDDDMTAQALIFFLAGFDAVSTLIAYIFYELAINPDIQEKLLREVDEVMEQCQGQITYEKLLGMKYLDNVVSETLRRYPPTVITERASVRPYTIEPKKPGEKPLHLETDSLVWIPIYAIHMDPKNYPDPGRFDPDRFNDENKHNIKPFTFVPFGVGPRNCIGSRFALLESKLITVEVLRHFELSPVEKTQIPIKLSTKNPSILPDGGIWVGLKNRK